jgi:hypothetical protein
MRYLSCSGLLTSIRARTVRTKPDHRLHCNLPSETSVSPVVVGDSMSQYVFWILIQALIQKIGPDLLPWIYNSVREEIWQ